MAAYHSELLELKNLGMASVNILRAIGINTYDDLERIGAVEAYRRIKARDINVSKVMLYALQGALMDVHWNDLPADIKAKLVSDSELPSDNESLAHVSTLHRQAPSL
jgi:DNA transformation protein